MVVNQDVAREILSRVMEPGRRYTVGGLQRLFEEYYDEWEDEDFSPIKGVGNVWKVAVKNSVRMSPDRPDYGDNSWTELRGEKSGRNYEYWIGEEDEGPSDILPRSVERARPKSNDGWDAERFVKKDLEDRGFTVANVSSGGFGCDLIAFQDRGSRPFWPVDESGVEHVSQESYIRVEVKSSVGLCRPSLTTEEMGTAEIWGSNYWLAVVDNFDPASDEYNIRINYIMDPASLGAKERVTYTYAISRESLGLGSVEYTKKRIECEDCSDEQGFGIHTFERYYDQSGNKNPYHAVRHVCETCGTVHTAFMTEDNWFVDEGSEADESAKDGVHDMDNCPSDPLPGGCAPNWDAIEENGSNCGTLLMPCQFCGIVRWYLRPEFLEWSC